MFTELLPYVAQAVAGLIRLLIKAGKAEGLTPAESLAKLRASQALLGGLDDAEWAELAGGGGA